MTKKDYFIGQIQEQGILKREGKDIGQERRHATEVVLWQAVDDEIDEELEAKGQLQKIAVSPTATTPIPFPESPWEKDWKKSEQEVFSDQLPVRKLTIEDSYPWSLFLKERERGKNGGEGTRSR